METSKYFISCDWGTTNFRLRIVETETLAIVFEQKTDKGVKHLYQDFLNQTKLNQKDFFSNYILNQLNKLDDDYATSIVIIIGMASANIGLLELDYGNMPFDKSGKGLIWKEISISEHRNVILVSGIKDTKGMMRGEEVQALGMTTYLEAYDEGILILPGTHSKHIKYKSGTFTALESYMTGELFELLSQKSILSNNVESSEWTTEKKRAFLDGVSIGLNSQLTSNLFSVRAKHLLGETNKKDNFYRLSGMLIGDEICYLKNYDKKVFLAASQPTYDLYKLALETFMQKDQLICFDANALEKAMLSGQKNILNLYATL